MKLVLIDLETGGVEDKHPDIQIAAVALSDWKQIGEFEAKIRFNEADADPQSLRINSYDPALWTAEALPEREVVGKLADFLRSHADLDLVSKRTGRPYRVARIGGHNAARFDAPRLVRMFARHNEFLPADAYRPLDTMQLALWRALERGEQPKSFALGELCAQLGIDNTGAHDALADVRICARVVRALLGKETK